jgi:hypothetical protein
MSETNQDRYKRKSGRLEEGGVSLMPASNGSIAREEEFANGLFGFWLSYKLTRLRRNIFKSSFRARAIRSAVGQGDPSTIEKGRSLAAPPFGFCCARTGCLRPSSRSAVRRHSAELQRDVRREIER